MNCEREVASRVASPPTAFKRMASGPTPLLARMGRAALCSRLICDSPGIAMMKHFNAQSGIKSALTLGGPLETY